ncbi:hypothetical protein NE237_031619 [Protea cynaroides]|uniref:Uncharacterized protein n=1 Tax=Protea cynaroides TaxID=273540 RepID=A0A9Q0L1J2_9MAGN|nr:hypothetical protein NE237_031619 [Protea cynaroides]
MINYVVLKEQKPKTVRKKRPTPVKYPILLFFALHSYPFFCAQDIELQLSSHFFILHNRRLRRGLLLQVRAIWFWQSLADSTCPLAKVSIDPLHSSDDNSSPQVYALTFSGPTLVIMENRLKGTVVPLASVFPVEEAQKAAKHVQDTIVDRQKELDHLHNFVVDNNNLVNLVRRLPDVLTHDVMVPFGKAAFFSGRLMHTNEFLVLLGEGYYVERTSKQTIEILQRRGKVLLAEIDSLKAMIDDLKTEASFFDATAVEASEGLVEIMEDFTESFSDETSNQSGLLKPVGSSAADNMKGAMEDEEYARVMARFDELEKEELAAESNEEDDEADFTSLMSHDSFDGHLSDEPQLKDSVQQWKDRNTLNITAEKPSPKNSPEQAFVNKSSIEDLKLAGVPKDKPIPVEKPLLSPGSREKVGTANTSKTEVTKDNFTGRASKAGYDSSKAFTGSIVEHTHGLQTDPLDQTTSQPSKPVSRFKMQKVGR